MKLDKRGGNREAKQREKGEPPSDDCVELPRKTTPSPYEGNSYYNRILGRRPTYFGAANLPRFPLESTAPPN